MDKARRKDIRENTKPYNVSTVKYILYIVQEQIRVFTQVRIGSGKMRTAH